VKLKGTAAGGANGDERMFEKSESVVPAHGIFKHAHNRANKQRNMLGEYDFEDDEFDFDSHSSTRMDNEALYQGERNKDSQPDGRGVMVYSDGTIYEGEFVDGMCEGKGRLIHAFGDVYEGDWDDNKAHGDGIFTTLDGTVYVGQWEDDKKHGKAVETWADGTK
jgi:hypothetical protein